MLAQESSSSDNRVKIFSSIPQDLHTNSENHHYQRALRLNSTEILAISSQEMTASSCILKQDITTIEKGKSAEKPNNQAASRINSFNWRLVYNPRCIMLGISTLLQVAASMTAYQCIPFLGYQTGGSHFLISLRQTSFLSIFNMLEDSNLLLSVSEFLFDVMVCWHY